MNNYCYNKLLWRPIRFRTFHLLHDRHYSVSNRSSSNDHTSNLPCSTSSNVNYDGTFNSGIMASTGLVRAISTHHLRLLLCASKAHFCTNTTTSNESLPDLIDQLCQEWSQVLQAEWEAKNAKQTWMGRKLKCADVLPGLKTSKLFLSTKNLTPEQLRILRQRSQIADSVELKLNNTSFPQPQRQLQNSINSLELDNTFLSGNIHKQLPDGILISVSRNFNLQEKKWLQRCSFDIRKIENPHLLDNHLTFLEKRHSDWCKLPGYATMLHAFKCQTLPEDTGLDPVDWVGSHGKNLDPSQSAALSAALNLKRPIVAVHGPPGSGKTHLLTEYLHILSQQGKKVLVVSSTNAGLYHLLDTFCKKFPSAASRNGNFFYLKRFDAYMASKVIGDETLERLIEKNSMSELQKNIDEKIRKNYELTHTLKSAMEKRPDLREDDLMREAEELSEQMREISHQMTVEATKKLLQGTSILFTNISYSTLNMFARIGLTFDVVIIDDAAKLSEFESWWMTLPTAPILRLFGDYNQPGIPVRSSIGRELNFRKSLLQRLDEQFGPEVNFHLRRQYRSNAAIQAWPNRAFYGQRAAEPDESVRDIRLDDLLEEGKTPPPQQLIMDPLVLVDLAQLEGEWRDWMLKSEEGRNSWQNWGETFLAASHLWHLFEHIPQLCPSKICYSTLFDSQRNLLWRTFYALFARHLQKLGRIRMEQNNYLEGQQVDVVLKDSVTVPIKLLTDPYHLKHLSYEMCRARRQFIWFANSKWLEEGSEQSRQLLRTFRQYGRIVGPDQLLPIGPGKFREMAKTVQENYQKTRDKRMRTNKQNDWITQAINFREEKQQMNNYCYNKLLWRPTHFRTFHLLRDRHYSVCNRISSNGHITNLPCSTSSNVNYDGTFNSGIMASTGLVRAISNRLLLHTIKAHYCTTTSNIVPSSDQNNTTKLPDSIEQQCQEWTQIVRAEWEAGNAKHTWLGRKLRCTDVRSSELLLSTEDLTPEQLRILRDFLPLGQRHGVELKNVSQPRQQSNSIDLPPLDNDNILGVVRKHLPNGILISVRRHFNNQQRQQLQHCSFDIRKIGSSYLFDNDLTFLEKRHFDWYKWPGYATMLQAFKCQPLPEDTGVDPPVDWVGSHGKDLDPSQSAALSAALNLKRPIVAVHGPPGSGKTRILAEYLHALSQQGKKVLVFSKSHPGLYHLMAKFCKQFPAAASSDGTFFNLTLKYFGAQLASKVIADETIERMIKEKSFLKSNNKEEGQRERPDLSEKDDLMREAEEVSEQMREISRQMKDKTTRNLLKNTSVLFTNISNSTLNMFARIGLNNFDVVIIDDAVLFTEFESWFMALPTAPVLRLFGNYNQRGTPLNSSMGRELNFRKSLLQRLDEQFGEEVNFHLQRQYRSNAAIQAWPNRAFYGQRAAEPDESVRNIRLDDLLEEGKSSPPTLITDPLVLVDLCRLKGEWREWMFKAEKGGKSCFNWGEAFLTASHLCHLFEHIPQLHPSKIAYITHHGAQRIRIGQIFSALFEPHLQKLTQICMERSVNLQGQQFDVVIEDSVHNVPPPDLFINPFHLKRLANEMCRGRRQFIWFANSKWLEEGSEQSRQLLQTFLQYGRIVGPNQLMPLERGQFREMVKKVEDSYWNYGTQSKTLPLPSSNIIYSFAKESHQLAHLCTSDTTISNIVLPSSDQTNTIKLPDSIEQQCQEWSQVLQAEWEAGNAKEWMGRQLKCIDVLPGLKTSRLLLSTEKLTPEQLRILHQFFQSGRNVEMKHLPRPYHHRLDNMLGVVTRHLFRDDILISVKQYFDPQQRQQLQQGSFDIREIENPYKLESQLNFLEKRESDWCKWPGYATMLQAFKCQPLPEDMGLDPPVGSHGKDLDPSQCAALSAALNLKRPIVAVHGPPGSGKTHLLTEYLHSLCQQRKKVLVVSKSKAGLFHLLGTFCKKFPYAAYSNDTFICLRNFDAQLASKLIADETLECLIEKRSFAKLAIGHQDEKTRENDELIKTLKLAMEARREDYSGEANSKQEAEEESEQMREISHQMRDEATKNLLQSNSVLFTNTIYSMLNLFISSGLTFDVVIIDDAARLSEFDSWWMTLPTAPVLRLFGDYNQSGAPISSSIGRELNFNKSLLQRLDEEFGKEVNFHLRRQYRSNAAIQAWPNRAFYGQRAAEPNESVRNIRLDDLLEEGKTRLPGLITDPLVLVDQGQLEGEWRDSMFKAEAGGKSSRNWGQAFLTASHLWNLFENIPQLCPSKIAYSTQYDGQCNLLWKIFSGLFARHLQKLGQIRAERSANLQGQQFDVVIEGSVTVPQPKVFTDSFHLKYLSNEMCRARRQFIWFANSKWLEEGSEQSRQLLRTFREYGRIVGPNQLLPLGPGQFEKMTKTVEGNYYQKMRDRRMMNDYKA